MNQPAAPHRAGQHLCLSSPWRRSVVAVLAVVVLLLAGGCGDSDSDTAGDTGGNDASETDNGSTDDGGSGGSGDFCAEAQRIEDLGLEDLDPTDLGQLQEQFQELSQVVNNAADAAPEEIQDDIETVKDAFDDANQALQSADSVDELEDNEAINALDTDSDVQEASNNVEEYVDENCDIETGGS